MTSNTETKNDICEAHILSDAPANEDAFGSHKRLADAIVSLISSGLGGKAIALSGSWGSGKSTVINFIRDVLRKKIGEKKSSVFVFDAWAHEGDPLRRTFIERLVEHLDTENWIKKSEWEVDLNRITRRSEETNTTSSPVLTLWGKCLVAILLLVPLGYALFGTVAKESVPVIYSLPLWAWGLCLVLLPLMFGVIVALVIGIPEWIRNRKAKADNIKPTCSTDAVFAFFVNKLQETNTTKTIRTPDPTTIEFQDIFVRVLNSALSDSSRQLVVVIDNIDRVAPEDALSIWATMRTLFEFDGTQSVNWRKQFWLIVPVDKSALSRLWASNSEADGLVRAFIEKTFQIEFRISPPILSDWKNYFVNQLELALPLHKDENELYDIYRLYRQKIAANHDVVTPRNVKLFINNIVTLHLQWGDRIPLQSQALFAIYSDKILDPQKNLMSNEFLDRRILNLVDGSDWQTHLAALHYNVDPKNAIQVLIGRAVEEALTSGKNEDLLKYKDIPGLMEVVERTIATNYDDWAEKEPAALALSGLCLSKAFDSLPASSDTIWTWLNKGLAKISGWKNFGPDVGLGIVEILKHCDKENFRSTYEATLKVLSKVSHMDETLQVPPNSWLKTVLPVVNYLSTNCEQDALKKFRVQCSAATYIDVMALLADENVPTNVKQVFLPKSETAAITGELGQITTAGKLRETHVKAVKSLMGMPLAWEWNTLASAISTRLSLNSGLDVNELYSCVRILLMLALRVGDTGCRKELDTICRNAQIFYHLGRIGDDTARATAVSVLAVLEILPNPQGLRSNNANFQRGINNFNAFLANPESQLATLNAFVALIIEMGRLEWVIQLAAPTVVPLVSTALKRIAEGKDSSLFTSKVVFSSREALRKLIGDDLLGKSIVERSKEDAFIALVKGAEFAPAQAWFYLILLKNNSVAYSPYFADGMGKITKDAWAKELDSESDVIALLVESISQKIAFNLRHDFGDALLEHAKRILSGSVRLSRFKDNWAQLKDSLRDDSRREFLANLRDLIVDKSEQNTSPLINVYGNTLGARELLSEQSDNVVRKLFTNIVGRGQEIEMAWLASLGKLIPELVNSCKSEYKTAFLDRVRDLTRANNYSAQSKESLAIIAKSLNIPEVPSNQEQEK